jgi:glycosyltransferase involved in cell wall biosynthesis
MFVRVPASLTNGHVRVLFIAPGPVPPPTEPAANQYFHLSKYAEGDLVTTVWSQTAVEAASTRVAAEGAMGGIRYHPLRTSAVAALLRFPATFAHFLRTGRRLIRERGGYDVILTYGALTTGLTGLILGRKYGIPVVVDMPGHPFRGLALQDGLKGRVKAAIAKRLVPAVLRRVDGIKLLYPAQLADLRMSRTPPVAVFHDFTAVGSIRATGVDGHYILLLGYPWFLKGVDVLIKAFLKIADRHPAHRLVVVGHCPDPSPFQQLAADHPRIELRRAVFAPEARALVEECSMLALPSRTEGMGRVVLEAFAARKPVVASRVDGLPFLIDDGRTGLLVEPGNEVDLAEKLDVLLSDPRRAGELATAGHAAVRERWNEAAFARCYDEFLRHVIARYRSAH